MTTRILKSRYFGIVLVCLTLNSCSTSFKVSPESFKTTGGNIEAFNFYKITVLQKNELGIPIDFLNDIHLIASRKEGASGGRKVFFNKKNRDYRWIDLSGEIYDVLPVRFKPGDWYYINGVQNNSGADYEVFFEVQDDQTFEVFDKYSFGPW